MTPAIEASSLLAQLANYSVRALALAAGAGLALVAFRVKGTSLRLLTWTTVLYAALAMPLLGRLLPPLPVSIPSFLNYAAVPPSEVAPVASSVKPSVARDETAGKPSSVEPTTLTPAQTSTVPPVGPTSRWRSIRWITIAAALYLAVAVLFVMRIIVGFVFGRRLMRSAQRIHESRLTRRLAFRAYACGLANAPEAAESDLISVPVTMAALRATILLPAGWDKWDDATLDAVVAHEVSHVARRDALTQWLSLLHRAIFWFSPLAWWLDRHLANLAEQASDEVALSCGADRNDYARTLLGFFEALQAAPGRVWWQGVSMAKAGQAEQRVERILAWRGTVTMSLKKSVAIVIISLAIPAAYLAASVLPASHNQDAASGQTQAPPAPSDVPAAPPDLENATPPANVPTVSSEGRHVVVPPPGRPAVGAVSKGGYMFIRPVAPTAPWALIHPPIPPAGPGQAFLSHRHGHNYAWGDDDEQRFVIVSGNSDSLTMSGSGQDARHAEKLKKQIPGDFIWFQHDEKSYIIRDQATIDLARKLWAPQEELGKKQEELGKQQEALGKQQQELGARMEAVHVQIPDMTAQIDKLRAEIKQLSSNATMDQIGKLQSEIGELQSKIGEIQSQAGEQQSKLGEEMGALGEKQGKLGEQQGELGEKQAELAREATRQMKVLLDEALSKGTAQPEP